MKYLLLLTLFASFAAKSQKVVFLEKADTIQKPEYQIFIYIDDKTDLADVVYVGKIKATGELKDVSGLFNSIKASAQKVGATAFKFESFQKTDAENGELVLSVYFVEGDFFDRNFLNIPANRIFIFGSPDLSDNKSQGYKLDGKKYEIESGKFQQFDIPENKEIKIVKGGITGMAVWVKRNASGYSSFFGFSGIGVNQVGITAGGGGGISINTGTIHRIEPNLALALLRIYTEKK
ncbi:hypothetical protein [Flavobacterium sp.]|uniref:hypothetical protein n=1 Tax=Flavobacterium sp. TaxID=239 RepID=UPI001219BAD3|nr:hypothetical protein [Flavobacterium sp.]RZJ69720.1 MAG: hypothetical protein EOO49_16440 [Flavobacterium sp.]